MVDSPHCRLDDALFAVDETVRVIAESLQHVLEIFLQSGIVTAEESETLHHILGGLDDFGDILHRFHLNPGSAYQAEERDERLFCSD